MNFKIIKILPSIGIKIFHAETSVIDLHLIYLLALIPTIWLFFLCMFILTVNFTNFLKGFFTQIFSKLTFCLSSSWKQPPLLLKIRRHKCQIIRGIALHRVEVTSIMHLLLKTFWQQSEALKLPSVVPQLKLASIPFELYLLSSSRW